MGQYAVGALAVHEVRGFAVGDGVLTYTESVVLAMLDNALALGACKTDTHARAARVPRDTHVGYRTPR